MQLHEQDELMWNDGVSPEAALDFDVPHYSKGKGLLMWLGGFAFFYGVFLFARSTNHPENRGAVSAQLARRASLLWFCLVVADVLDPRCVAHRTVHLQLDRDLPESTMTTSLGSYPHGKY